MTPDRLAELLVEYIGNYAGEYETKIYSAEVLEDESDTIGIETESGEMFFLKVIPA